MKNLIVLVVALLIFAASPALAMETHASTQDKPAIKALFFVLGYLDEYMGRSIVEKNVDIVERFCIADAHTSQLLEKYLKLLVTEEAINTKIRKEISDDGDVLLHSPELYQRVNSMYRYSFENSHTWTKTSKDPNGPWVHMVQAFVSKDIFKGQDKAAKLSYLAGAYARYGHWDGNNRFYFSTANAGHKIRLIAELLKELGCKDILHETSDPNALPVSNDLIFTASPEISALFDNVSKETNGRDRHNIRSLDSSLKLHSIFDAIGPIYSQMRRALLIQTEKEAGNLVNGN